MISYTYQWRHNGVNIDGATSTYFRVDEIYEGETIDCVITATNENGIATNTIESGTTQKLGGTLWSCGYNNDGRIGDGTTVSKSSPVQIGNDTDWKQVYGTLSVHAIKTDGTLWGWGLNTQGQLGDGTTVNKSSPTQVGSLTDWKMVTGGVIDAGGVLAIKTDGTLWAWGINSRGNLGDGTTINKSSPIQIGTLTDWKYVSNNGSLTHAIKTDGTLWSWGYNEHGYLGDGTNVDKSSPVQVGTDTWITVNSNNVTSSIKTDGTLWAWGDNGNGGIGDGTTIHRSSPVQIGTSTDNIGICGKFGWKVVKTDGTLWTVGYGGHGGLGENSTIWRSNPVQIGGLTDWKDIYTYNQTFSLETTMAIKTNGTIWAWGINDYGNFGDGTTVSKSSPIQIGTDTNWEYVMCGEAVTLFIKHVDTPENTVLPEILGDPTVDETLYCTTGTWKD